MNTISEYQFIQVPMILFYTLEGMTRDVLVTLIQISSNYANDNGYFFYPIESIAKLLNCDKRLVQAGIETLHRNNILEVKTGIKQKNPLTGGVRTLPHIFRVKFERFHEFEQISISDILNDREYNTIKSVNYKDKNFITYNKTEGTEQPIEVTEVKPKRKYTKKKEAITQQVTVEEDNKKEATVQQTVQQVAVEDANQDKERICEDCCNRVDTYKSEDIKDYKDYYEIYNRYVNLHKYLVSNREVLGLQKYTDLLLSIEKTKVIKLQQWSREIGVSVYTEKDKNEVTYDDEEEDNYADVEEEQIEEDNKKEATVQQTVQQVAVEDAKQDKERIYEGCYDKVEDYKLSDCKDYDEIIKKYLDVYYYLKKNEKELGEENYDKLFSIAVNERDKKHDKLKKDGAKKINQSSTKSADKDDCLNNIFYDVDSSGYIVPAYAVEKREGDKANLN